MPPSKIGKYTVLSGLGSEAEGLYLCEYASRRVAIRLPEPVDAAERDRIAAEARQVAGLSHPNVALQEVGLHEGQLFLVSDLSGGTSLDSWLQEEHSLADQLRLVEELASALAHVHEQGVFHRALKPSNVLVADGECQLMNFGLATSAAALGDAAATYAAPETLDGMPDSAQSDIYSAGVVFYEILSGSGPGTSDVSLAKPLREVRPELSKDLADAVMACRERSADWRPKDLSYLLEVVRRARGTVGPPSARAAAAPRSGSPAMRTQQAARSPSFATRATARSPLPILIGIALVVVAGVGAWFVTRTPGTAAPAPPRPVGASVPTPPVVSTVPPSSAPAVTVATRPPRGAASEPAKPSPAATGPRSSPTAAPTPTPAATREPARPTVAPTTMPPATLPPPRAPSPAVETTPPTLEAPVPAEPSEPAVLTAVSPPVLKRGARTLVDVRGTGLRNNMQVTLFKGRAFADGLRIVGRRYVNPTLIQVFIETEPGLASGTYALTLGDDQGSTNNLRFEVK
jgi:serine/threonine protein kinase